MYVSRYIPAGNKFSSRNQTVLYVNTGDIFEESLCYSDVLWAPSYLATPKNQLFVEKLIWAWTN